MRDFERIPRVGETALRCAVLRRRGDVLVGARCHRPDRHSERWSVHACNVANTDVAEDIWSQALSSPCHDVVVHEDAGYVATCEKERLLFWDLATGAPRFREMDGFHPKRTLPGGRLLSLEDVPAQTSAGVSIDEGTRACILDVERGALAANFGLHDKITHVSVDAAGAHLIACGDRSVLWHLELKQPVLAFDADAASTDLTLLPGGSGLRAVRPYSFAMSGPVLLDVKVDALRVELTRITDPGAKARAPLLSFAVSPDGRWLATGHADHIDNHHVVGNVLCVWDLEKKELATEVHGFGETSPTLYAFRESALLGVYEGWNDRELFHVRW